METRLQGTGTEVVIGPDRTFCAIGERINPTNKPRLTRAIKEGDWGHLQRMARRQVKAGANVVDINVGVPGADEAEAMRSAVRAVQEVIDVPISIDSSTIDVLLAGLEVAEGRPLVNSVPAEETYMKRLQPAIKDRDVPLIGMCMRGGANMPTTVEERLEVAENDTSRNRKARNRRRGCDYRCFDSADRRRSRDGSYHFAEHRESLQGTRQ